MVEKNIDDYKLVLDKEGYCQNTLKAALRMGVQNVSEEDSQKANFGIRISDMLAVNCWDDEVIGVNHFDQLIQLRSLKKIIEQGVVHGE